MRQPDTVIEFPRTFREPKGERTIKARWNISEDRYVEMSVSHWPDRKCVGAAVLDHLVDGDSVKCMPFSMKHLQRVPVARYSQKALRDIFDAFLASPELPAVVQEFTDNPTAVA